MSVLACASCRRIPVHQLLKRLISFPSPYEICALVSAMAFSLPDPQGAPRIRPW